MTVVIKNCIADRMIKMFDKDKYETRSINEKIPLEYRILMWKMIEEFGKTHKLDYLQVFEFSKKAGEGNVFRQGIVHKQECPAYREEMEISISGEVCVEGKVYVIDDGDYATMLWAEEY